VTAEPILYRPELPTDAPAIAAVVASAFGRPAEARLVDALRASAALDLSLVALLVAFSGADLIGHVALSAVSMDRLGGGGRWQGLAPLSVSPAHQRRGIGRMLVQRALAAAEKVGVAAMFVLGSPDYSGRLGFAKARPLGWRCVYDAPSAAFRVRRLAAAADIPPAGTVRYRAEFAAL
jgi:putative acetyltransferase